MLDTIEVEAAGSVVSLCRVVVCGGVADRGVIVICEEGELAGIGEA